MTPSDRSEISIVHFPELNKAFLESSIHNTPLSPPISPIASLGVRNKRPEIFGRRLKGKAGLKLNESTLRQYTEYDVLGGTPRSPFFATGPGVWTPNTFGEPHGDIQSNLEKLEDALTQPLPIFDVYAPSTVMAVFQDPAAMARMRQFAEPRGHANDIDFLLQIGQYNQAMTSVASILANMSLKFTGVAASEPVRLPLTVGKALSAGIRETSKTLMPGLESTFDDAKSFIEQTLAQDLYPDFVKHQLSLNLQVIGPGYSPNQVCPGFGEAFCLSDPNEEDDPIVFASDGLACLTGYSTGDMISRNCRLFQGPGTRGSCVDRMRNGLAKHDEFTELVLNYTKDGRPYWNLVFMARLAGADGTTRFHLGGQVDVTEILEREEELTHLLSYVFPLGDRAAQPGGPSSSSSSPHEPDRRSSWRGGLREKRSDRERHTESARYPPSTSRNKFLRTFRRRHSPGGSSPTTNDSCTDMSLSEPSTPGMPDPRKSSPALPTPGPASAPGHFVTVSPYSRFMVLEYTKPAASAARHAGGPFHDKLKAGRVVQLPVAFCSSAALESLGHGGRSPGDVLGRSVFDVLAERAGASVTKSFRSTVRASMAEGRAVKLDVGVGAPGLRQRVRGLSLTRKRSGVGLSALMLNGLEPAPAPSSGHEYVMRRTLSLERLVPCSGGSGPVDNFVSYWTPLKDDVGATQWVVVILVPEVA